MKRQPAITLVAAVLAPALLTACGPPDRDDDLRGPPDSLQHTGPAGAARPSDTAADSAAVAEVVNRFHEALEAADSTAALTLLTDDVVVLESGGVETKQEYRSHHLSSDIAFASAVPRESGPVRVVARGDVAWATSTSTTTGTFRDRPVNSQGVELMVLVRTAQGWRISAIHWSSRPRR